MQCGARAHPTQCFRRRARVHPRQCVRCGARVQPKQCFRCGARVHPNRLLGSARRERAARRSIGGRYRYLQRGWGLSNPRGGSLSSHCVSYSVAGSGKWATKIGDAVGAAFAALKCAIERGDELKLRLDSCVEGPHFVNALLCLVAGGYAELFSPQYPRRRLGAQTMLPVPKFRGV